MDDLFKNTKTEELILRPLQVEMVNQVREAFHKSRRIILQAATAAGKTAISAKIIQQAVAKGKRCLFIADRIILVNQTSESFERWGITHGIVQADNPKFFPNRQVQIASAATLVRRPVGKYDLIIQDEAHVIHKGSLKAFDANPNAFILGLTASPYSNSLGKIYDFHIQPFTVKYLIEKGVLCPYEAYGPVDKSIDLSNVKVVAGEWDNKTLGEAVDKPKLTADIIQTWRELGENRKTIVFSVNVAHSRALQKEFIRHGIQAREINAYLPKEGPDSAKQIIEDFRNDKFKILISVTMATTGFDVPDVSCVVFACSTKSMIKFTQALGRGLRLSDGKSNCIVLDHGSLFSTLGWPDEYSIDQLDDGKKSEASNKKKEKKEKLPTACLSCGAIKPAGIHTCPACGFAPKHIEPVKTEDGELKKLERKQKKARKEYTLLEKQAFLSGLNHYAAEKGYKIGKGGVFGWSINKYISRFGSKPPNTIKWNNRATPGPDVLNWIKHENIKYAKRQQGAAPWGGYFDAHR